MCGVRARNRSCGGAVAAAAAIGAVALTAFAGLELGSWRASRAALPHPDARAREQARARARATEEARGHTEAIVVLGCPSRRDGRTTALQRWRTNLAVRSRDPRATRTLFVFTGRTLARPPGEPSEAEVMAAHAVEALGVDPAAVLVEPHATSTRENVAFALPLVREHDVIVLVSTPPHARRARRYLAARAPELAVRLARADDHRFGESLSPALLDVAYEWRRRRRIRRAPRGARVTTRA